MAEAKKEPRRPLPTITELTEPYWHATKAGKLLLQRCKSCGELVWCPRPACIECGSEQLDWEQVSGRGTVYSFTVIRQVAGRGGAFAKDIPYVIAWVDLEEGPRFYTNIVDCPIDEVKIGMPVEVTFDPVTEEITLPKFKPV